MLQWLKLPAWKVRDRGFEPHSGIQVSKKRNVSTLLTREDLILWGAAGARISNHLLGGQCHIIHLRKRFSWPSLAYMCKNVA